MAIIGHLIEQRGRASLPNSAEGAVQSRTSRFTFRDVLMGCIPIRTHAPCQVGTMVIREVGKVLRLLLLKRALILYNSLLRAIRAKRISKLGHNIVTSSFISHAQFQACCECQLPLHNDSHRRFVSRSQSKSSAASFKAAHSSLVSDTSLQSPWFDDCTQFPLFSLNANPGKTICRISEGQWSSSGSRPAFSQHLSRARRMNFQVSWPPAS